MFNTLTYDEGTKNSMGILQQRLRELMIAAGWSEQETADKAGLNQPTVHRIMSGESKSPRTSNLLKLAKVFGVSLGYLTGERPRSGKQPLEAANEEQINFENLSPAARKLVKQIISSENIEESDFLMLSELLERFQNE